MHSCKVDLNSESVRKLVLRQRSTSADIDAWARPLVTFVFSLLHARSREALQERPALGSAIRDEVFGTGRSFSIRLLTGAALYRQGRQRSSCHLASHLRAGANCTSAMAVPDPGGDSQGHHHAMAPTCAVGYEDHVDALLAGVHDFWNGRSYCVESIG